MKNRYLEKQVKADLERKMVFVGGPRQSGKTTLAKKILGAQPGYLNWDADEDQSAILKKELPTSDLWVFDEIHKYRNWRRYLKGIFDKKEKSQKILMTGSARLDWYRFGGDSLQGRYHYLRLHPLTLAEIDPEGSKSSLLELFQYGCFPEPFFGNSKKESNRWSLEYRKRLVREDIASLEQLQNLTQVELLTKALPDRVGSVLSINSLREDLGVAHKTMSNWLNILERCYSIYRVPPFGAPKLRAVKKEQKHYHFDYNLVESEGPRFENLIANHLLKWVHYLEDTEAKEIELKYFRDIDLREVDFVLTLKNKPILMIEVKLNQEPVTKGLRYLKERFPNCEAWQIHLHGEKNYKTPEGIRVAPANEFLKSLV